MGSHINKDGLFQSDKYPTCPAGKVPLSVNDTTAQDLLWEYAQRRRSVDAEFSDDLETALRSSGYKHVSGQPAMARLPDRKEWDAAAHDRGDIQGEYESSDYVDGWNEALDAVEITEGCPVHAGVVHGGEAEELRAGIEKIIEDNRGKSSVTEVFTKLHRLLDRVDVRDSLAHLEQVDKDARRG